jgi:hypothetical protein
MGDTSVFLDLARRYLPSRIKKAVRLSAAYAMGSLLPSRLSWRLHYFLGGTSGSGSRGRLAEFKARVLNAFVADNRIASVVEFGCGDGHQLSLAKYPKYLGFDVSSAALGQCRARFRGDRTKSFEHLSRYTSQQAELALSLDVIFHLVEDATYHDYMKRLFASAQRFVIVYSSNHDDVRWAYQYRHRAHSRWVAENARGWELKAVIPNDYPAGATGTFDTSYCSFYIYERQAA